MLYVIVMVCCVQCSKAAAVVFPRPVERPAALKELNTEIVLGQWCRKRNYFLMNFIYMFDLLSKLNRLRVCFRSTTTGAAQGSKLPLAVQSKNLCLACRTPTRPLHPALPLQATRTGGLLPQIEAIPHHCWWIGTLFQSSNYLPKTILYRRTKVLRSSKFL